MNDSYTAKKDAIKELIECGKSPLYFIKKYAKIQHPLRGLITFDTFSYQDDLLQGFINHRFNIVLKSRQVGVTTLVGAYIAWFLLFHRDKNVLCIAIKQDVAKNIIRVVRTIFKNLPKWLQDLTKITIDNRQSIELSNGSRVKATTTVSDAGRSEAVSLLIVDETAHIKKFDEVWVGLWPTLSTGGRSILFSTPNGTGNLFHKLYSQAQNNENLFNCRFGTYINPSNPEEIYDDRLMWWVKPGNDDAWFKNETMGKSPREIAQEYGCSFVASGETFIFPEDIVRLEAEVKEPIEKTNFDRNLWIWKYPTKGAMYLIACDISRGDSRDFSAFHVLRIDTKIEQVAEYRGKITPDILGFVLVETSKKFNNAIIAVENNGGWSGQTILRIRELNHPFMYYTSKKRGEFVDPYYAQYAQRGNYNDYAEPGYAITPINRLPILAKMEQYVRMKHIDIYSSRLVDEFRTFAWNNSKPEAQRGYHDDLVMSLAGGLWIREESFMAFRSDGINKMLLENITNESTSTFNAENFNYNSNNLHQRGRIKEFIKDQNRIIIGTGESETIDWLLDPRSKISLG